MKAGPLDLAITPDRSSIEISSWNQPSLALSSGASVLLRMGADAGEFAGDIVESVASLRRNRGETAANPRRIMMLETDSLLILDDGPSARRLRSGLGKPSPETSRRLQS
jgi:hypothetical protein